MMLLDISLMRGQPVCKLVNHPALTEAKPIRSSSQTIRTSAADR
jgi:hypothetical protein